MGLKIVKLLGTVQAQAVVDHVLIERHVKGALRFLLALAREACRLGTQSFVVLALALQEGDYGLPQKPVDATVVDEERPAFAERICPCWGRRPELLVSCPDWAS